MPERHEPTATQPMPTTTMAYAGSGSGRGVVPVPPPRPPRRRSNPLPVVLVVLLVLAGLLIAGDRLGVGVAERSAADQLRTQLGLDASPSVQITGIPFLTQLATSTFPHVAIDADDVPIDATTGPVPIDHLHLDLRTVHASEGFRRFEIGQAEGWAQLGWSSVSSLAGGVDVSFDSMDPSGQGRVKLVVSQAVFGQQVQAEIRATPLLDPTTQTIGFTDPAIRLLGVDLPGAVGDALLAAFLKPIPVAAPLGLTATGVTVTSDGVRLELAGENLTVGP